MSAEILADRAEAEAAHNILARDFTDRYIHKIHLSAIAHGAKYNPRSPLSDYETTWWPAAPKWFGEKLAAGVLAGLFRMRPRSMDRIFYSEVERKSNVIGRCLARYPVMAINGHSPDLQAAIPLFGISRVLADPDSAYYQQNLREMFLKSHVVATRGLLPLKIGRNILPRAVQKDNLTLLRAARLITNPHFTFPRTPMMEKSDIPQDFFDEYNARARADCLAAVRESSTAGNGMHQMWSMAPGAGPDLKGKDSPVEGLQVTQIVKGGTIKLVKEMGVALLPVYASFRKGPGNTVMEFGDVITPKEVGESTLHDIMRDLAVYRRTHGEENVYYQGELT